MIIDELRLQKVENRLSDERRNYPEDANLYEYFEGVEKELLEDAKAALRVRIRKDTRVVLHIRGRDGNIKSFLQMFEKRRSFLNRRLTYLLYKCGAFALDFSELSVAVKRYGVPDTNVLCRYGANTIGDIQVIFKDPLETRLNSMKIDAKQTPSALFPPGVFRSPSDGERDGI